MRFNFEAYEQVYPPKADIPTVESAVDTFKPTEEKAKDQMPGDNQNDPIETPPKADKPEPDEVPEPQNEVNENE